MKFLKRMQEKYQKSEDFEVPTHQGSHKVLGGEIVKLEWPDKTTSHGEIVKTTSSKPGYTNIVIKILDKPEKDKKLFDIRKRVDKSPNEGLGDIAKEISQGVKRAVGLDKVVKCDGCKKSVYQSGLKQTPYGRLCSSCQYEKIERPSELRKIRQGQIDREKERKRKEAAQREREEDEKRQEAKRRREEEEARRKRSEREEERRRLEFEKRNNISRSTSSTDDYSIYWKNPNRID